MVLHVALCVLVCETQSLYSIHRGSKCTAYGSINGCYLSCHSVWEWGHRLTYMRKYNTTFSSCFPYHLKGLPSLRHNWQRCHTSTGTDSVSTGYTLLPFKWHSSNSVGIAALISFTNCPDHGHCSCPLGIEINNMNWLPDEYNRIANDLHCEAMPVLRPVWIECDIAHCISKRRFWHYKLYPRWQWLFKSTVPPFPSSSGHYIRSCVTSQIRVKTDSCLWLWESVGVHCHIVESNLPWGAVLKS